MKSWTPFYKEWSDFVLYYMFVMVTFINVIIMWVARNWSNYYYGESYDVDVK